MIRELKDENSRLKKMLADGHIDPNLYKELKQSGEGDKTQIDCIQIPVYVYIIEMLAPI